MVPWYHGSGGKNPFQSLLRKGDLPCSLPSSVPCSLPCRLSTPSLSVSQCRLSIRPLPEWGIVGPSRPAPAPVPPPAAAVPPPAALAAPPAAVPTTAALRRQLLERGRYLLLCLAHDFDQLLATTVYPRVYQPVYPSVYQPVYPPVCVKGYGVGDGVREMWQATM